MLSGLISFFTTIPLKTDRIEEISKNAWLFPVVGLIIGPFVYIIGLMSFKFMPIDIASVFSLISIYMITGLIHLDGLADFSDGIMASGDSKKKIAAMKDLNIGIAGLFSVLTILLLNLFCIRQIFSGEAGFIYGFLSAIVISEVSAKLGMNTCLLLGRDIGAGMGSVFIRNFSTSKYLAAVLISVIIALIFSIASLASFRFLFVFTGVIVSVFVVFIANRHFGGVNGDVIGAVNEISRAATLLLWVVV